jgi:hypothetical protein
MPFILIHGTFHLVGRTQAGNPTGFEPDGDSIQFQPANPALLDQLDQPARPYRLSSIGSTQLRLEAIDALELHFDSTHRHDPWRTRHATSHWQAGLNPDATPGFILSRSLEVNGRPIAFAFTSAPPRSTRRRSAARAAARGGQMVCRPYRTRSSRARSGRSPAWPGR